MCTTPVCCIRMQISTSLDLKATARTKFAVANVPPSLPVGVTGFTRKDNTITDSILWSVLRFVWFTLWAPEASSLLIGQIESQCSAGFCADFTPSSDWHDERNRLVSPYPAPKRPKFNWSVWFWTTDASSLSLSRRVYLVVVAWLQIIGTDCQLQPCRPSCLQV